MNYIVLNYKKNKYEHMYNKNGGIVRERKASSQW